MGGKLFLCKEEAYALESLCNRDDIASERAVFDECYCSRGVEGIFAAKEETRQRNRPVRKDRMCPLTIVQFCGRRPSRIAARRDFKWYLVAP